MSVRWNTKRVVEAIRRHSEASSVDTVVQGLGAIRQAEEAAFGKKGSVELNDFAVRKADAASAVSAAGGQAPPAVRVMGLLGRMRQLAMRGTSRGIEAHERATMGEEMARLSVEIDDVSTEITRIVPRGEIPASYDSVEAFFESVFADETLDGLLDPFSSYSLGVDSKSIGLSNPGASRLALEAIDDALEEMQVIHRNGASTEAHLDAALERLSSFVDSIDPNAVVPKGASEAIEAAECVRLFLMSGRGVSPIGQSKNLQQSVTALLQ